VVASSPADAINQREVELGIEGEPYDVRVEAVADPDGSKAQRWLERFGF
jgi:hypothetical protein